MSDMEVYNSLPVVPPLKSLWSIDDQIYSIESRRTAANLVTLQNRHDKKLYTMLWTDFVHNRQSVYPLRRTADLVNRNFVWLKHQIWRGAIPEPIYRTPDGKPPEIKSRFSLPVYNTDGVFAIRNIMAERLTLSTGTRLVYVPSMQELRRRMGLDMLTYTRTTDGRFIPIWQESV